MYWVYYVTTQIHRRRNSTTNQREGGIQSQEYGTHIRCSGHWVQKCPAYCRLLTQWPDATLRRDYLASERAFSGNESRDDIIYLPVRRRSVACMERRLARAWMLCGTDGSTRCRRSAQLCTCIVCLPSRQQRLTTALGCICKCTSGWGKEMIWTQKNGAGYECGIALSQE